jgi:hypothetical protein
VRNKKHAWKRHAIHHHIYQHHILKLIIQIPSVNEGKKLHKPRMIIPNPFPKLMRLKSWGRARATPNEAL